MVVTFPRRKSTALVLGLLASAMVLVLYFATADLREQNNKIDFCFDDISPSYITDAEARKKFCGTD
jgi:hypothetical protein